MFNKRKAANRKPEGAMIRKVRGEEYKDKNGGVRLRLNLAPFAYSKKPYMNGIVRIRFKAKIGPGNPRTGHV